jgi:hypothetical protein
MKLRLGFLGRHWRQSFYEILVALAGFLGAFCRQGRPSHGGADIDRSLLPSMGRLRRQEGSSNLCRGRKVCSRWIYLSLVNILEGRRCDVRGYRSEVSTRFNSKASRDWVRMKRAGGHASVGHTRPKSHETDECREQRP